MAKILLADSDPKFLGRMLDEIESLGDHRIVSVSDGLEALGRIYAEKFDLVILDADLPNIGGLGLFGAVRKRRAQTVGILTYRKRDFQFARQALSDGVFELLEKAPKPGELKEKVSSALAEARQMKTLMYANKDSSRSDPALVKRGVVACIGDSLLVGLTFFLGPLDAGAILGSKGYHHATGIFETLMMSLGIAACYAFAFVFNRSHRTDFIDSPRVLSIHLLRNLVYAYTIQIAISFIAKESSMQPGRLDVALGFFLGLAGLAVNRFVLFPAVLRSLGREGRKKIVIETLVGRQVEIRNSRGSTPDISIVPDDSLLRIAGSNSRLKNTSDNKAASTHNLRKHAVSP